MNKSVHVTLLLCVGLLVPELAHAEASFGPELGWLLLAAFCYPVVVLLNSLTARKGERLRWFLLSLLLYPLSALLATQLPLDDETLAMAAGFSIHALLWFGVFIFILLKRSMNAGLVFAPLFLAFGVLAGGLSQYRTWLMLLQSNRTPTLIMSLAGLTLTTLAALWWIVHLLSIKDRQQSWLSSTSTWRKAIQAAAFVVAVKAAAGNLCSLVLTTITPLGFAPLQVFYLQQGISVLACIIGLILLLKHEREQYEEWIAHAGLIGLVFYSGMSALSLLANMLGEPHEIHYWHYLIPSVNYILIIAAAYGFTRWRTDHG
ncbi:MAG TPA: hypothetical protein VFM46_18310 [Pseudomonadales bacterium]|nr:hypothetical protein [Pseudomonadales bacterium]